MATLWKQGTGNVAGPNSVRFYAVCEIGYSGSYAGGYNVQCRRYIYVSSGQSSNFTSNMTVSWSSSKYACSKAGTYADTGWVNLGNYAYGTTPSISAYCYYQGGSGTVYRSDASVSYTVPYQTYTHTTNHYFIGFNGETGTLSGYPNHYILATGSATVTRGATVTLSSYATTVPANSYLSYVLRSGSQVAPSSTYTQDTGTESWNYYYYPYDYGLTYELDGGSLPVENPSSYNVLYGHTINQPVKSGSEFLGWEVVKEKLTYTAGSSSNYAYVRMYENCEPGVTYTITMDNARVTSGSASQFSTYIYDFTDSKIVASVATSFGTNRNFTITCPKDANPTHELVIITYSAIGGSTANIYSSFDGTVIKYFSPVPTYSFDFNNTNFVYPAAINSATGEYVTGNTNYTTTPDYIPIEGGTVLYSNMIVCGVYTYDSNKNFIKRESSYTYIHPISSNAAYIRIEIAVNTTPLEQYRANFIMSNEMGINKGLNATFSSPSVCYEELRKRTSGNWTFMAIWKPIIAQDIYFCKDGSIYARNFIQSDDFYFTKDGDFYAPSFIIGDKIGFSPAGLMATAFKTGLPFTNYTCTDENGNILTDENGNILEGFM